MPKSQHPRVVILLAFRITYFSMSIYTKIGIMFIPHCNDYDKHNGDKVMMLIMVITTKIMTTMVNNNDDANDDDNDNDSLFWQRSL